jgi:hypothetical protein
MKIRTKLTTVFLFFTFSIILIFYFISLWNQDKNSEEFVLEHIKEVKSAFHNLEERDTKILFSALEVIMQDAGIKAVYLENKRRKLYDYVQQLFHNLRDRYGITHYPA